MSSQYCDICGHFIESIDFHLTIKGGCICPSCVPLARSVAWEGCHEFDRYTLPQAMAGQTQYDVPTLPNQHGASRLRPMYS